MKQIAMRLVVATVLGIALYLALFWILGWSSDRFGYGSPVGNALGVAAVVISPLAYGLLVLPLVIVAIYYVLRRVIKKTSGHQA